MATTADELKNWFFNGIEEKATHMIVVCDTFDWEDYPVYVKHGQNFWAQYEQYDGKNMQKIMEVYDLQLSWEGQSRGRVFKCPPRVATNASGDQ